MKETIVLVDSDDKPIGFEEKDKCHSGDGKLHRAFSIFVFNDKKQLLIQKRSKEKMLWGGFWANTCCSHPRKGEKMEEAVHRRLEEEFGFDCELKESFDFIYKAKFKNIGSEHELDHVFVGFHNGRVKANPKEVAEWKWIDRDELRRDLKNNPDKYAPWFTLSIDEVLKYVEEKRANIEFKGF